MRPEIISFIVLIIILLYLFSNHSLAKELGTEIKTSLSSIEAIFVSLNQVLKLA